MNTSRQSRILAAAASLGVSVACGCIAHAQAIFNTQDDFAAWPFIGGTGGTVVTNDNFDSDNSQYNGLGTAAPAGAGGIGARGSQQATINAEENNPTDPGSDFYQIGLSNNLIGSPDATAALNDADFIAVDFNMIPPDSADPSESYFELKLIFSFTGQPLVLLDEYANPKGTFNPMGIAQGQDAVVNNGSYMTAYYQDDFVNGPSITNLQIGYYFNSNFNELAPDTFSIDDVRVVAPGWNQSGSGDWNTASNWTTGLDTGIAPSNQGLEVDFLSYVTSNTTVTTSATVDVGTIRLDDSANTYTLAASGGGNITMNMPGVEPALINDAAGSHLISAPVVFASSTCVNVVGAGDTLTLSGAISGAGGLTVNGAGALGLDDSGATGTLSNPSIGVTAVNNGSGTVELTSGNNTYAGTTTIDSGTLIAAVTGALPTGTNVADYGNLIVNGNATLGSLIGSGFLNIYPGSSNNTVKLAPVPGGADMIGGLLISAGSALDITSGILYVSYPSFAQTAADSEIRGYLVAGYAGGTWTGMDGINSSVAALPANRAFGVGYADGADGVVAGLPSGQIEVMYTLYGDANLDGVVNGDDFTILASNLGKFVSRWDQGDFNYDGEVNGDDFTLLIGNLGKEVGGGDVALPASDYAAIDAFAAANGLMADVPEPSVAALMVVAASGILSRRYRRALSLS